MDTADSICRFFANSPKRQLAFERIIEEVLEGEKCKKLKSLCKTRWVERHEAFEVFVDFYEPLMYFFEVRDSSDWNQQTKSDAQSFFLALSQFPFVCALILTKDVLAYTKALSIKLQGRYMDIVKAYKEIEFVMETLQDARANVDDFHLCIYSKVLQLSAKVNIPESLPRTTGRQQYRNNVHALSMSQCYKRALTTPMLDYIISEVSDRFHKDVSATISQFMLLLPSEMAVREEVLASSDIADLIRVYGEDLPSLSSIDAELHSWGIKWKGKIDSCKHQDTPAKVLTTIDCDLFPNIKHLLKIACTLTVTSVKCERPISRLRYLKNYLRSTMTEERLNGLALMYIHRDIECIAVQVVDEFARKHPRQMALVNPFSSKDDEH